MSDKLVRPQAEDTCAHMIPESMRGKNGFWDLPEQKRSRSTEVDDGSGTGWWLWAYITTGSLSGIAAAALTIGATATAKVDQVLGTGIGPSLERVHVSTGDGDFEQYVKEQLHKLGAEAVKQETQK